MNKTKTRRNRKRKTKKGGATGTVRSGVARTLNAVTGGIVQLGEQTPANKLLQSKLNAMHKRVSS